MRSGHMRQESLKFSAPTVGCGLRPAAGASCGVFPRSAFTAEKDGGEEAQQHHLKDLV